MTFLKISLAVLFCGLALAMNANADPGSHSTDLRDSLDSSVSTKANLKKKKSKEIPNFELVVPSFVVHGTQPDSSASNNMPRKLVGNGDAVVTPGLGLEYKGDDGFMALGAVIKDCYNDLAGTLQLGEYFRINHDSFWGVTLGVYARETPIVCTGYNNSNCYTLDSYNVKFVTYINGESVDIIPMPFLHYTYVLYRDKQFQVNFKFMGNIALNEFGFDIPF